MNEKVAVQTDIINGEFPQNLYDYILNKLKESGNPALSKRPFNGVCCMANIHYLLNMLITSDNNTLSDEEKELFTLRFINNQALGGIAESKGKSVEVINAEMEKGINSIVTYLCLEYGSKDLIFMGLSKNALEALKSLGITDLSQITGGKYFNLSKEVLNDRLCALVWRNKISKKTYNEIADFVSNPNTANMVITYKEEDDVEKNYPSNILSYINSYLPDFYISPFGSDWYEAFIQGIIEINKDGFLKEKEQRVLAYRFKEFWTLEMICKEFNESKTKVRNLIKNTLVKILQKYDKIIKDSDSVTREFGDSSVCKLFSMCIYTNKEYFDTVERIKEGDLINDWEDYLRLEIENNTDSSLSDEDVIRKIGNIPLKEIMKIVGYVSFNMLPILRLLKKQGINTVEDFFLADYKTVLKKLGKSTLSRVSYMKKRLRKYADIELTIDRLKEQYSN